MKKELEKATISGDYINPVVEQRADPWVYKHTDGYYYFTASVPEFDRIEVRRSRHIQELGEQTRSLYGSKHNWTYER